MRIGIGAVAAVLGFVLALPAAAETMSEAYITGVWHTGGAACGDASGERVEFSKSGALVASREGEADASGF